MWKRIIVIVPTSILALTLLGAGCRKAPAPSSSPPVPPAAPAANAPAAPTSLDPLADDLDAAIDDLEAIE